MSLLFPSLSSFGERVRSGSRLAAATALAFAMSIASAPAVDGERSDLIEGSAGEAIYGGDQLEALPGSGEIVYDYTMEGELLEEPFHDEVRLKFSESEERPGNLDFEIALFPETGSLVLPTTADTVNPIMLVYFQRDANFMSRNTGGSPQFFRSSLRTMLGEPAEVEEVTIKVDGQDVPAQRLTLLPYDNEEARERMPDFAKKSYSITLSSEIPGRVYELSTAVPAADGDGERLRETYRFRELIQ